MDSSKEFELENRKQICYSFIEAYEVEFNSFLKDNDCADIISIDEEGDEVYSEPGNYDAEDMMYEFCLNHPNYWVFVNEYMRDD